MTIPFEDLDNLRQEYRIRHGGEDPSLSWLADKLGTSIGEVSSAVKEYKMKFNHTPSPTPWIPPQERYDRQLRQQIRQNNDKNPMEKIYRFLNFEKNSQGVHINTIADYYNLDPMEVRMALNQIEDAGRHIIRMGDVVSTRTLPQNQSRVITHEDDVPQDMDLEGNTQTFIAVVSDTHLGAKAQQITYVTRFLEFARDNFPLTAVFHPGDLVDGTGVYQGQPAEVFLHGADDQLHYAVDVFPNIGVPGYMITGNHDDSFLKKSGTHIVKRFCELRDDYTYVGDYGGMVEISGVKIEMYHGAGGITENPWSKLRKKVQGMAPNKLPDILLSGHWHQPAYLKYRGVSIFSCASFAGQTSYLNRLGIVTEVGGMVLEIVQNEAGEIIRVVPHRCELKEPLEDDYPHWGYYPEARRASLSA